MGSMKTQNGSVFLRSMTVCGICALDLLCGPGYLYLVHARGGTLFSAQYASDNIGGIFIQGLIVSAFPILLFLISLCILKKDFLPAMYLRIQGKKQVIAIGALIAVLMGMTAVCLAAKADWITILYNLFYYLVFIAFTEEFVVRGVCVHLLSDFSWKIRYLLPNLIFALMHIFAYANFGPLTFSYVLHFLTSNVLGLTVVGCLFQLLKEKSGTLWIPILLHAICDYSVIFTYS